jgi:hypothetical protein
MATPDTSDAKSTQYLIGRSTIKSIGFFFAGELASSQLNQTYTPMSNAAIHLIFNRVFSMGIFGTHQLDRTFAPSSISNNGSIRTQTNMGGLIVAYHILPDKLVNLSIPLEFGVGYMSLDSTNNNSYNEHRHGRRHSSLDNHSKFGFVSPGVNLNLNVFKYGLVYAGAKYRISTNVDNSANLLYYVQRKDIDGLYFDVGLKLGIFEMWKRKFKSGT